MTISQREMALDPVGVAHRRRQFREEIQAAQTPEGYCRVRWPGIAFRLPTTERTSRWTYQNAGWRAETAVPWDEPALQDEPTRRALAAATEPIHALGITPPPRG